MSKKKSKKSKNDKKVLTPAEVESEKYQQILQKQQSLIDEAKNIIISLTKQIDTKYKFNFFKKNKFKQTISHINDLIDQQKFDEIENLISTFKKIDCEEKDNDIVETKKISFKDGVKNFFKNFRIPIYGRCKKIIHENDGKIRLLKLLGIFGFVLLMIGILIVGLLMFANIIPFKIGQEENFILPALLVGLSLGVLFFI